jgi:hypothetical protein
VKGETGVGIPITLARIKSSIAVKTGIMQGGA